MPNDLPKNVVTAMARVPDGDMQGRLQGRRPPVLAPTAPQDLSVRISAPLDLSNGPMVIDMPPGAYIGLVDDYYQSWILDLGLPGPTRAKSRNAP